MVVNRVGDICLILAMGLIVSYTSTLNFPTLLIASDFFNESTSALLPLSCLLLLLAAVGKSAQVGLHT